MSLRDDGKLFHTNEPATKKAHLPRLVEVRTVTAALVTVERTHCPAASDVKLTRLTGY